MELGRTIQYLRKQRKITQGEMGKRIGMSVNNLSMIETGQTFPPPATIKKICEAMGLSVAYIIIHSMSAEDVKPENKHVFNLLKTAMLDLLLR
jgi:transcriptional regulator with XRE-family HTH domain